MRNIDDILADSLSGEPLSTEEQERLTSWTGDGENEEMLGLLKKMNERKILYNRINADVHLPYNTIKKKINRQTGRRRRLYGYSIAAGIALLAGIFTIYRYSTTERPVITAQEDFNKPFGRSYAELQLDDGKIIALNDQDERSITLDPTTAIRNVDNTLIYSAGKSSDTLKYNILSVPPGAEYNLLLADGTQVFLNSGSEIRYPVSFSGKQRKVFLSGEAFFRVAPESSKKFIVETEQMTAVVLGTSFNIRAYPSQNYIAATLEEGSLQVVTPDSLFRITPGKQVVFNKEENTSMLREVNTKMYTSWKDGYYFFDQVPLDEILATIATWYDVNISYQGLNLKDHLFSGRLKRYDSIQYLLKKFEDTNEVLFTIEGNNITVKRK